MAPVIFFTAKAPPMLPLVISYRIREAVMMEKRRIEGRGKQSLTLILISFFRIAGDAWVKCIEAFRRFRGHQSWRNLFRVIMLDSHTLKSNFLCMKAAYYDGNSPSRIHEFLSIILALLWNIFFAFSSLHKTSLFSKTETFFFQFRHFSQFSVFLLHSFCASKLFSVSKSFNNRVGVFYCLFTFAKAI